MAVFVYIYVLYMKIDNYNYAEIKYFEENLEYDETGDVELGEHDIAM